MCTITRWSAMRSREVSASPRLRYKRICAGSCAPADNVREVGAGSWARARRSVSSKSRRAIPRPRRSGATARRLSTAPGPKVRRRTEPTRREPAKAHTTRVPCWLSRVWIRSRLSVNATVKGSPKAWASSTKAARWRVKSSPASSGPARRRVRSGVVTGVLMPQSLGAQGAPRPALRARASGCGRDEGPPPCGDGPSRRLQQTPAGTCSGVTARVRSGLAAGELLAQGGQGLVGGQGAAGGGLLGGCGLAAATATAGVLFLFLHGRGIGGVGLGRTRLLDLLAVRLEAGLRLGVVALPLVALNLEALEPLAALGVEALGVLVVALLVVVGGHAVQGRVEVHLVGRDGLVGLLQREADAAAVEVDVDDLDEDLGADLDDLLGHLDVALGQFGDVDQALDALLDTHERTERNQLGDLAGNDLADLVRTGELLPGVLLRRLERQGDTLALHVHVENLDGDLLADLDDLAGVVDVLPRELGDVNQTVDATQVHEGTEVDDRGDDALADLALLEGVEEGLADLGLGLLEPGTAGKDHVVAVLVQLDDLGLELTAHVGLQVTDTAHLDQGSRQEAAEADVEDETTLDDLDDGAGDDAVLFLDLLDRAPGALVLGALLGQDQAAFLVLLLENEGFDLVADGDDLARVDVVLDREFA